ncbi:IS66 family insertion sequence element accessory protein TnpB [Pseudomonas viridiflava]|uniref:IS66 family insertion sequence element accessory protein TnpB n=1 Tax=Pseudomonas viridiflava TaxID=33069 RepID=UPI0030CFEFEC
MAALVELDIKFDVFAPLLFVFLNSHCNGVKIVYWERNDFCLWLRRMESERFKPLPMRWTGHSVYRPGTELVTGWI